MVAEVNIDRQEFNSIKMAKEYSYQIGLLLKDKLGRMQIKLHNYSPTLINEVTLYTITLRTIDTEGDSTIDYVIEYTSQEGDTVDDIIIGLEEWVIVNANERLVVDTYLDSSKDEDKYMFFVPKEGISLRELNKNNLTRSAEKVWMDSDTPACYVGYGKHPTSSLPRIIVTPVTQKTICNLMEKGVTLIEGVETEFTSSYIDYTLSVSCEAGSTDQVLQSNTSALDILNNIRRMFTNEIVRNKVQSAMNSVIYPITDIASLPVLGATQYMDIANYTVNFSAVDRFIPTTPAGFTEAVEFRGTTTPDNNGTQYKNNVDGEVIIYGETYTIDRRDLG